MNMTSLFVNIRDCCVESRYYMPSVKNTCVISVCIV